MLVVKEREKQIMVQSYSGDVLVHAIFILQNENYFRK